MRASEDFPVTDSDWQRCADKIVGSPAGHECWIWGGGVTPPNKVSTGGYPRVRCAGKVRLAHRVAWLFFRGPIGPDLTIDHLCRNRACVNPWHMDPCPIGVNAKRSPEYMSNRAHCKKGHPYPTEPMGTRADTGANRRWCRQCNVDANRLRRAKAVVIPSDQA